MAAHHRHVAGMIMHAVLLLVGGIVLFIDDDEAKVRKRQEQCRARAGDHAHRAFRHRMPGAGALARGELRVPFGRPRPEPCREAVEELARQRDLRHQDQALAPARHRLGHRLEIHLGLAGAGDAVDEGDGKAVAHGLAQRRAGRRLGGREIRHRIGGIGRQRDRIGRQRQHLQRALVDQAIDDADRHGGLVGGLGFAAGKAIGEELQHPRPRRRHALRRRPGEPDPDAQAFRAELLAHPQRHPRHHAARAQRIIRDPIDEAAQFLPQRRQVELGGHVFKAVVEPRIGIWVVGPHHGGAFARPQRHPHDVAGAEFHRVRHAIGIGLVERDRNQHVDDALCHGGSDRAG